MCVCVSTLFLALQATVTFLVEQIKVMITYLAGLSRSLLALCGSSFLAVGRDNKTVSPSRKPQVAKGVSIVLGVLPQLL